jgi:spore maturation protein CgeB
LRHRTPGDVEGQARGSEKRRVFGWRQVPHKIDVRRPGEIGRILRATDQETKVLPQARRCHEQGFQTGLPILRIGPAAAHYRADLSYLGTYSEDRQSGLEALFVAPARLRQDLRFLIGGAQYPPDFPWSSNIYFVRHLPPSEHAPFFASSRLTLNVTRRAMAQMGWCPSGRLFEAAACGTPLLSDRWTGLETFFQPGEEILLADDPNDTLAAFKLDDIQLSGIARRARERTLDQHSSKQRATELIELLEQAASRRSARQTEAQGV